MNDLTLQNSIDENLRPVKVAGQNSALEISTEKVRVKDLEVTGDVEGVSDSTKLPLAGGIMTGNIGTVGSFRLDGGGDISLDATGDVSVKDEGTEYVKFSSAMNISSFTLYEAGGASEDDYFNINTNLNGVTKLVTKDNASNGANLTLDIDGDITLDSETGVFIAKKAGTEFSAANSSYAGMILGMTYLRNATDSTSRGSILFSGTTWAIFDSYQGTVAEVTFTAPPSGNVEITLNALASNTNDYVELSLSSDNSSYTEVNAIHTYEFSPTYIDESDRIMQHYNWIITGLTAGTSYTYSVWGRTNGSSNRAYFYHGMQWGYGGNSKQAPPITMKAIALPATLVTGE